MCRTRGAESALAALVQTPDVDVTADLALVLEWGSVAVPELDPIARARLHVHDDVADDAEVLRLRHAFPARVPHAVLPLRVRGLRRLALPVFAVAVVVPDDLPQLLLPVV